MSRKTQCDRVIDLDPYTATVTEWREAYSEITEMPEETKETMEVFLLMARVYGFAEDAALWPQAEDLINSHGVQGDN
jgi:hypothetical protein